MSRSQTGALVACLSALSVAVAQAQYRVEPVVPYRKAIDGDTITRGFARLKAGECTWMRDGCNDMGIPRYDRSRVIARSFLTPHYGEPTLLHLLLSDEVASLGQGASVTMEGCSVSYEFECVKGSPPRAPPNPPPPEGPGWLPGAEVHESWVSFGPSAWALTCLSPDYRLSGGPEPDRRKFLTRYSICFDTGLMMSYESSQ